jgi:hypothetical protein
VITQTGMVVACNSFSPATDQNLTVASFWPTEIRLHDADTLDAADLPDIAPLTFSHVGL